MPRTEFVASWNDWEGTVCVSVDDYNEIERKYEAALARCEALEKQIADTQDVVASGDARNHSGDSPTASSASSAQSAEARDALELLREIDGSGVLFRHAMELDAKVANMLHRIDAALSAGGRDG